MHFLGGAFKHLHGGLAVRAIDENGSTQSHELSKKGCEFQGAFGGDGAILGENLPAQSDVEFGLMVCDDDAGSRLSEPPSGLALRFSWGIDDLEADSAEEVDELGEFVTGDVLGGAVESEGVGEEGVEGAEGGSEHESEVRC